MKNDCSIVVLAAGFGTRMQSSTPKVLHKICGKEMLFYVIDESIKVSDDVHIILFNEFEFLKECINKNYANSNLHLHLQNHAKYPGTAGALMKGVGESPLSLIDLKYENVLVLNGDMPLVESTKLEEFINSKSKIAIGILLLKNPSGYGRVVIENGFVKAIIEEKDANEEIKKINSLNAGIYKFSTNLLRKYLLNLDSNNNQSEFYLTDVISFAFKDGEEIIPIFGSEEEFMGVNSKFELSRAEEFMLEKLRFNAMQKGVRFILPKTIYLDIRTEFIGECEIESGVVLKGKNKIINSKIKSHSVVEDSYIKSSQIGPLAHIRPKSKIIDSNIGNFTEVKASSLNGVKAGHLSYIGDSEIESGTNIGAGVITCNYDGKKKHKTIIGENVFIGSDVQLIAPLNIESNVIIAAGSTVNKNAKDGDLVISRTVQNNKSGFFYKFFKKDV